MDVLLITFIPTLSRLLFVFSVFNFQVMSFILAAFYRSTIVILDSMELTNGYACTLLLKNEDDQAAPS